MRGVNLNLPRAEAAQRALNLSGVTALLPVPPGAPAGTAPVPLQYALGVGGKDPSAAQPGEPRFGPRAFAADCSGFICWAMGFSRHHDQFPHWGGDISTDSIWEACEQHQNAPRLDDWFGFVDAPMPGDIIVYPGHRLNHAIGHCGVVTSAGPVAITDCHFEHHGADHAVDTRGPELWLRSGGRYVRNLRAA